MYKKSILSTLNSRKPMKPISDTELKSIQLEIMKHVHNFCESNHINYSLAYGSLLGAIRHKGFIPWDDDIDIVMLRKDYERFLQLYPKHSDLYKVHSLESDPNYAYAFAKVSDPRTLLVENVNAQNIGVNIDVFPLDNAFDDLEQSQKYAKKISLLKYLYRLKFLQPSKKNAPWKRVLMRIGKIAVLPLTLRKLATKISSYAKSNTNQESKYVVMMVGTTPQATLRQIVERSWFNSYTTVPFEGTQLKIITEFDKYLSHEYGDYMTPPKNKTSPHTLNNVFWI